MNSRAQSTYTEGMCVQENILLSFLNRVRVKEDALRDPGWKKHKGE